MMRLKICGWIGVLVASIGGARAFGLTIIADFVEPGENLSGIGIAGDPPASSVGGGSLADIFGAAAKAWEQVIHDDFTIALEFGWYPTRPISATAYHQGRSAGGSPSRELSGSIAFNNTDANFYLDPTPHDDSEFGPISETEIDLGAGALVAQRELAPATDVASGRVDLLSTALHEIGHALGLTGWGFYDAEVADGKIDVMQTVYSGTQIPVTSSHIDLVGPVMSNRGRPLGHRRKITQVDLLAVCQVSGFEQCSVISGDYDFNGIVDVADIGIWKQTFNSTTELAADGNNDGIVDAADYTVWRDQRDAASGTSDMTDFRGGVVPEPSSLALLCCVAFGRLWMARSVRS